MLHTCTDFQFIAERKIVFDFINLDYTTSIRRKHLDTVNINGEKKTDFIIMAKHY